MFTKVKTPEEIRSIKESGQILATVLNFLQTKITVGMSTKDLALIADKELRSLGGEAAFLGYQGFPDVICISLNEEVVHGIPKPNKMINDGDIVSLDFGVLYKGMITDAAISLIAGQPKSDKDRHLIRDTKEALNTGISLVKDGVRTGDIGSTIEEILNKHKYGIVRTLVGHGVGHLVHEDPNIPNYGRAHTGPELIKGMTVAIEPMVTLGGDNVFLAQDGWTVITSDKSRAAHFEHTVLITENGSEILTALSA